MRRLFSLALILIVLLSGCTFKTAGEYYSESSKPSAHTVTVTINCSTAVKYLNDNKRTESEILTDFEVGFDSGDTVFDALKNACKQNKIQFEYDGSGDSVYIKGIDYLYEFDCGDLSGWEYCVNGEFPNVGCNAVKLSDGDDIKWLYTCDLGADIGNKYEGE